MIGRHSHAFNFGGLTVAAPAAPVDASGAGRASFGNRRTMKAYLCHRYGGAEVLHLADIAKPIPNDGEILVRIHATSVTSGDVRLRAMAVPAGLGLIARLNFGLRRPRQPILGTELAGVVEAVGLGVTKFQIGDAVIAFPGGAMGCHAEYRCIAQDSAVAHKPSNLSFAEAASLSFGGSTALHFLRKAKVKSGETILIVGAAGGVGTALVQLARHQGAVITAVTSGANADLVRSLGAEFVIDYTAEDFTKRGDRYDVIMDVVGATTFNACKHMLGGNGRFAAIAGGIGDMLAVIWAPLLSGKKVLAGPAEERSDDVILIAELAANGTLQPVVDRSYPFQQLPMAHAYVDTARKRGAVVITLDSAPFPDAGVLVLENN